MAVCEEVQVANSEKRHELKLSGPKYSNLFKEENDNRLLFEIGSLNSLEISRTGIRKIPTGIGKLTALAKLVLYENSLTDLPESICKLSKLKILDLSNNKLENIPDLSSFCLLESLNLSGNELKSMPSVSSLVRLHVLDLSNNRMQSLPDGITCDELVMLASVDASNNEIDELPTRLPNLPSLKIFNVANNRLLDLPEDFIECPKLKSLTVAGNCFKDRKLQRLANDKDDHAKHVLEYLKKNSKQPKKDGKQKNAKKQKGKSHKTVERVLDTMKVSQFKDGLTVQVSTSVADVRPYIVCCIAREISFHQTENLYKKFITMQTKLHDTVCEKRQAATIATHDLAKVKRPLIYDAKDPSVLMIKPLFKSKDVTAESLMEKLRTEADAYRKEKKRSTVSGIHKYLDLLNNKTLYPCLLDRDGTAISFPPITNSDCTKISVDTTEMLLEVTSTVSLDKCKFVMQTLLEEMLQLGVGVQDKPDEDSDEGAAGDVMFATPQPKKLVLEQVQILDPEQHMKVVYPSRVDLSSDKFKVERDF